MMKNGKADVEKWLDSPDKWSKAFDEYVKSLNNNGGTADVCAGH